MGVGSGSELDVISDLPVIYNLIDLGKISNHAVSSLNVTAMNETWFDINYYEKNRSTYLCIHLGGLYG